MIIKVKKSLGKLSAQKTIFKTSLKQIRSSIPNLKYKVDSNQVKDEVQATITA
jgi:hypothetical protein